MYTLHCILQTSHWRTRKIRDLHHQLTTTSTPVSACRVLNTDKYHAVMWPTWYASNRDAYNNTISSSSLRSLFNERNSNLRRNVIYMIFIPSLRIQKYNIIRSLRLRIHMPPWWDVLTCYASHHDTYTLVLLIKTRYNNIFHYLYLPLPTYFLHQGLYLFWSVFPWSCYHSIRLLKSFVPFKL